MLAAPDEFAEMVAAVGHERGSLEGFDLVTAGAPVPAPPISLGSMPSLPPAPPGGSR